MPITLTERSVGQYLDKQVDVEVVEIRGGLLERTFHDEMLVRL